MDEMMQENQVEMVPENQKKGMGIAAIIIGAFSILCCSCMGVGLLFAIIGAIFSIICLVKGTGSGKTFGIIGIILNGIGFLLGAYMAIVFISIIDWSHVNMETLRQIDQIDVSNQEEYFNWLQQFFKVDISSYYR